MKNNNTKFSLTLFLIGIVLFLSSCSSNSSFLNNNVELQLNIQANNKNKEIILESLLKERIKFSIDFQNKNSYLLDDDLLNSNLKFFCNGFIDDQREVLERYIFKNNITINKSLIVFTREFEKRAIELEKRYPNEKYYLIKNDNFEDQIKKILGVNESLIHHARLVELDKNIQILHSPRIKNDISLIYFLMDYDYARTIVPIFKNYAFNIDFYSSSEIFHNALDFKKLLDFEDVSIPFTNDMIQSISKNQGDLIKKNIELSLINDFINIENVHQNSLFRDDIKLKSSSSKIKRNSCVTRDLKFWKISPDYFNQT